MTISEIDSLYARIFRFLYQMRIKEAITDLGYLIQQNGFGPAYDELVQQETTYRYLLRYRLEGVEDKERDKVLLKLIRTLCELADSAYRQSYSQFKPMVLFPPQSLPVCQKHAGSPGGTQRAGCRTCSDIA